MSPNPYLKGKTIPKIWAQTTVIPESQIRQIFNPFAAHMRIKALEDIVKKIAMAEMEAERPLNLAHRQIRDIKRGGRTQGEMRYAQIKKDIDALFPEGKFDFQEQLLKQLVRVSMKHILGKEYQLLIKKISKNEGWDTTVMNVVFIAARRGGKTTGTAGGLAALSNNIPSFPVVVFSGGMDSATELCQMVGANLRKIAAGKNIKVTKKRTTVYHPNNEESTVTPFPSSGQYDVSLFFLLSFCVCGVGSGSSHTLSPPSFQNGFLNRSSEVLDGLVTR